MCVRASAHVCSFCGSGRLLAVRRLVVVSVLLGQRGPGLLHFLSFLSALDAVAHGRINHHAELLAQVRHLVWEKRGGAKGF